jgi:protein-disulfide isomerase
MLMAVSAESTPPLHRRRWQMGGSAVLLLLVAGIAVLALRVHGRDTGLPRSGPVPGAAEVARDYAGIPQRGTVLGRADAPHTLVLYADPQCPFCGRFERKALPDLVRHEVRAGTLRIDLRLLTFIGPDSTRAARTLLAAGIQDRAFPLAALMARFQGDENSGYVTPTYLRRLAAAVPGLDVARVGREANGAVVTTQLAAAKNAAQHDGVKSTPWLLAGPTGGTLHRITSRRPSAGDVRKALGS